MELLTFLPLIIIMGVFLWFSARRQRKLVQATIDLHDSLRVGDRVHTTSGLQAGITAIGEDTVDLEIAPGVVTRWMKMAVRDRIEPEPAATAGSGEVAEGAGPEADRLAGD